MRLALALLAALLAGCAAEAPAATGWTFTERDPGEPAALAAQPAFEANVSLASALRQIGGQWHDPLAAPVVLRWEASAPMRVEWRALHGSASASGRCDWDANETAEKDLGLARVNMRSDATWCELRFAPNGELAGEPTLKWEARSRDAGSWSLRFDASYPTPSSFE